MITASLTILAIFLVGMLIPQLAARSIIGPVFRVFVVPGVIVHELAHAGACLITGAEIRRIRFFKREGGDVAHTKSPIPLLGPLVITFAPLLIGFAVIIVLGRKIAPGLNLTSDNTTLGNFPSFLWQVAHAVEWGKIATWVWLYFVVAIGATLTPSPQDLKNSWFSLVLILAILVLVLRTPSLHASLDVYALAALPALTLALFILLLIALLVGAVYTTGSIFGITR